MRPKLILCDLDGTLLRSDKTISDRTAAALAQCQGRGILTGFCTSRGKTNVIPFERRVHPDVLICNGGACVVREGSVVHTSAFTLEQTQALLAAAYAVCGPRAEITLDTQEAVFWNRTTDKSTQYDSSARYDDFSRFDQPALKICVQTDSSIAASRIAQSVPGCDVIPFSDIPWHKFSAQDATKEHAITVLCGILGINPADILAFGDDHNDIGMLRLCGTGVAMGNAIEPVKTAARATTASNDEDGVAQFLEEHVLA